jgi:hypothetical protein
MNPYQTPQAEPPELASRKSGLRLISGASILRSFVISIAGILVFVTVTDVMGMRVNANALMGGVVVYLLLTAAVRWQAERSLLAAPPEHEGRRALWAGPARMRGSFLAGLLFATAREFVYRGGGGVEVLPLAEIRKIEAGWWFRLKLQMADGEVAIFRMARPRRWKEALERLKSLKAGMIPLD